MHGRNQRSESRAPQPRWHARPAAARCAPRRAPPGSAAGKAQHSSAARCARALRKSTCRPPPRYATPRTRSQRPEAPNERDFKESARPAVDLIKHGIIRTKKNNWVKVGAGTLPTAKESLFGVQAGNRMQEQRVRTGTIVRSREWTNH